MSDILKTAETLNAEVSTLNKQRSKLEGMLESAKSNYDNAVKAYAEKYGVDLTPENLQEEYNRVYAQTKGAMLDLQEAIESIKRGDYKKDIEEVEFDLEPNVEPIREEPKPEKKRGRKSKAKKEETIDTEKVLEEATVVPTEIVEKVEETKVPEKADSEDSFELPKGPINFNFSGFGEPTAPVAPVVEEKKEVAKTEDKPKTRKPISAEMISQAVASTDATKQHPVTLGSDEDDEVDLSTLGFGSKPAVAGVKVETPKVESAPAPVPAPAPAPAPTAPFSFGDFGNMGMEEKKAEDKPATPTFGDFGGFGGFGGLDDAKPVDSFETEKQSDTPVAPSFDFSGFGGFGDIEKEEKSAEGKKEDNSNADLISSFGNIGNIDFDALMNNAPKFGE